MKHPIQRALLLSAALLALSAGAALADSAKEIDERADAALGRFYSEVKEGRALAARADAILVMPRVVKGGLIVGGEYGEGALRVGGRTVAYYNVVSGSVGLTAGGEVKDMIILFLQEEALRKFRDSHGWKAGVDGNIVAVKKGEGQTVMDISKTKAAIVGYIVGARGLIVDASFNGSKFSRIKR